MPPAKKAKKECQKVYKLYDAKGTLTRKGKFCPKCGPGHFLANHANRVTCGTCHYTEFLIKEKKE